MKIVVLAGGNSTERDVSLISGMGVYKALKSRGHQVILLDVYLGIENIDVDNAFALDINWDEGIKAISENNPDPEAIRAMKKGEKSFFGPNVIDICRKADIRSANDGFRCVLFTERSPPLKLFIYSIIFILTIRVKYVKI